MVCAEMAARSAGTAQAASGEKRARSSSRSRRRTRPGPAGSHTAPRYPSAGVPNQAALGADSAGSAPGWCLASVAATRAPSATRVAPPSPAGWTQARSSSCGGSATAVPSVCGISPSPVNAAYPAAAAPVSVISVTPSGAASRWDRIVISSRASAVSAVTAGDAGQDRQPVLAELSPDTGPPSGVVRAGVACAEGIHLLSLR